jgi:hypothetical protein
MSGTRLPLIIFRTNQVSEQHKGERLYGLAEIARRSGYRSAIVFDIGGTCDHREITKGQTCPAHRVLSLRKFDSRLRLHRAECRAVSANQPPLLCAPDSRIACLQFCCFPRCRDELGCCPFKIRRFFLLVGTNKVANFFAKKA